MTHVKEDSINDAIRKKCVEKTESILREALIELAKTNKENFHDCTLSIIYICMQFTVIAIEQHLVNIVNKGVERIHLLCWIMTFLTDNIKMEKE